MSISVRIWETRPAIWSASPAPSTMVVSSLVMRMRAARPSLAPRPMNAEYYAQRATEGGLLIAEASPVVATGFGNGITQAGQVHQRGLADDKERREDAAGGNTA